MSIEEMRASIRREAAAYADLRDVRRAIVSVQVCASEIQGLARDEETADALHDAGDALAAVLAGLSRAADVFEARVNAERLD